MRDIQREADVGDERADDLTVEQAVAAIKRCQFSRRLAMTDMTGAEVEGDDRPVTALVFPDGTQDEVSVVIATALVTHAKRIWWHNDRLACLTRSTYTFPDVYPAFKASCGYCGHTYHAGACDLDGIPTYKAGRSA